MSMSHNIPLPMTPLMTLDHGDGGLVPVYGLYLGEARSHADSDGKHVLLLAIWFQNNQPPYYGESRLGHEAAKGVCVPLTHIAEIRRTVHEVLGEASRMAGETTPPSAGGKGATKPTKKAPEAITSVPGQLEIPGLDPDAPPAGDGLSMEAPNDAPPAAAAPEAGASK